MFVKGKARLGQFVHKKTATCIALTKINESDKKDFDKLIVNALANFNNNPNLLEPGMPILGHKSQQKKAERIRQDEKDILKKAGN